MTAGSSVSTLAQLVPTLSSTVGHPNRVKAALRSLSLLVAILMAGSVAAVTYLFSKSTVKECVRDPNKFGSDDTRLYFLKDNLTNVPCETDEDAPNIMYYFMGAFLAPVIFFFAQVYGLRGEGHGQATTCCGPCVAWIVDHIIAFAAPLMLTFVTTVQAFNNNGYTFVLTQQQKFLSYFFAGSCMYSFCFFLYVKTFQCTCPCLAKRCCRCEAGKWLVNSIKFLLVSASLFGTYTTVASTTATLSNYVPHHEPSTALLERLSSTESPPSSPPTPQSLSGIAGSLLHSLLLTFLAWNPVRSGNTASFLQVLSYAGVANKVFAGLLFLFGSVPFVSPAIRRVLGIDDKWEDKQPVHVQDDLRHPMITGNTSNTFAHVVSVDGQPVNYQVMER